MLSASINLEAEGWLALGKGYLLKNRICNILSTSLCILHIPHPPILPEVPMCWDHLLKAQVLQFQVIPVCKILLNILGISFIL